MCSSAAQITTGSEDAQMLRSVYQTQGRKRGAQTQTLTCMCIVQTKHNQVHIQLKENPAAPCLRFSGLSKKVQGKETSQGNITHDIEVALLYKLMWVTVLQQVLPA